MQMQNCLWKQYNTHFSILKILFCYSDIKVVTIIITTETEEIKNNQPLFINVCIFNFEFVLSNWISYPKNVGLKRHQYYRILTHEYKGYTKVEIE